MFASIQIFCLSAVTCWPFSISSLSVIVKHSVLMFLLSFTNRCDINFGSQCFFDFALVEVLGIPSASSKSVANVYVFKFWRLSTSTDITLDHYSWILGRPLLLMLWELILRSTSSSKWSCYRLNSVSSSFSNELLLLSLIWLSYLEAIIINVIQFKLFINIWIWKWFENESERSKIDVFFFKVKNIWMWKWFESKKEKRSKGRWFYENEEYLNVKMVWK